MHIFFSAGSPANSMHGGAKPRSQVEMALQGCSFTRTIGQKHNRTRRVPQPILLLAMMALSASSWGEPSGPLTPGARAAVPSSSVPPVAAEPTGQCLPVAQMAHAWLLRLP